MCRKCDALNEKQAIEAKKPEGILKERNGRGICVVVHLPERAGLVSVDKSKTEDK